MEGSLNQEVLVISEKNLEEKTDTEVGILLKSIVDILGLIWQKNI